jgi:AraC-like DNA-binding protein
MPFAPHHRCISQKQYSTEGKIIMTFGPLDNPVILQQLNYHLRLRKLVMYMREHATEPLRLDDAAAIVCMEKTAFCRFFKRTIGITFHEFVQQWKIANAVEQMMLSDCTIAELAYALGFDNINTFGRTFKKVTRMTPSAYRRKLLADCHPTMPINRDNEPITVDS